jgi:phosphoribosylaminoimidazole-succinocarboxamide synthase
MKQHTSTLGGEHTSNGEHIETKEQNNGKNEQINSLSTDTDFTVLTFESEIEEGKENQPKLCALRNTISSYLFEYLHGFHIPTHFISKLSETEMSIKNAEAIALIFKIYNTANGQLTKRFNLKEGVNIEFPIIEHYFNLNNRNSSWVNEYHIYGLGISTPEEFKQMNRLATKVNAVLRGLCDRRNLNLSEVNLTFGRFKGQMLLCGELSPLTCHFLDASHDQKNKRDRFTLGQVNTQEALMELADRLMVKA